jgi:5-methylcytosine-specific restriction endonuclease McrA
LGLADPVRSPARYEANVFERDHYTCRYCGLQLVSKDVLVALERVVGPAVFCCHGPNAEQHGIVHAFKIVADHVVPHRLGGRTSPDNLVSACPGCNYGKDRFTLEQLGLEHPMKRAAPESAWDGLVSFLPALSA